VQFSVVFRRASDNTIIPLSELRLTAFDVDGAVGSTSNGPWEFRETVEVAPDIILSLNNPTTLTDAGTMMSDGIFWRRS
jgi:hypothetical protein